MIGIFLLASSCVVFQWNDREIPAANHMKASMELRELAAAPMTPQLFGNAGLEHMEKYGRH